MRRDSRLSVALHVLMHMTEAARTLTSEELAASLGMNAVVLRRTLGALRDAGILNGDKGHGGGWSIARDLEALTLLDVFDAIGGPRLFAIGPRSDRTRCPIEQTVDRSIGEVLAAAEKLARERFAAVSVDSLLATARGRSALSHSTMARRKELRSHV